MKPTPYFFAGPSVAHCRKTGSWMKVIVIFATLDWNQASGTMRSCHSEFLLIISLFFCGYFAYTSYRNLQLDFSIFLPLLPFLDDTKLASSPLSSSRMSFISTVRLSQSFS